MKTTSKRILSMLLVFVMVFSLLPGYALAADDQPVIDFDPFAELENEAAADESLAAAGGEGAEAPEEEIIEEEIVEEDMILGEEEIVTMATTKDFSGCTVADLGISATDANGSGSGDNAPVCSWVANGTNITGSLVGGKDPVGPRTYYYESTTVLTLTNNKTTEAELSFKYSATTSGADFGDITVNGEKNTSSVADKEVSATLAAGESITITLHVPQRTKYSILGTLPDPNGASITISDIKLVSQGSVTVEFAAAENGSYTVTDAAGAAVTVPGSVSAKSTDRLTMTATPADGYVFAGWYQTVDGVTTALSADLSYTTLFEKNATVKPMFMPAADGVYGVGEAVFTDLTEAATAAANSTIKTVVLLKDATLIGDHTIPMGVTLLIPYNAEHTLNTSDPDSVTNSYSSSNPFVTPSAFRTLTMASGSSITVDGAISVNAKHESCVGGAIYGGSVNGKYGAIKMEGNASITLKKGSNLYAWGYIWGDGEVEALSGATVYEKMQVTDYRGGTNTSTIALRNGWGKSDGAFPFNQYYIQNVEVKEVLHEGAVLMAHAAVNLSGESPVEAAVEFIGSSSAMFTVSGATITKDYLESSDRLSLSVDGGENSYMELNGMKLSMGTLSIDSANYTLPINGNIDININAGTAVVNQEVVLQPGVKVFVDSDAMLAANANIYVMDIDQWGNFVFSEKRQQAVVYTPSLGGRSTRTINSDAVIDINGYVVPIGGLFTTAGGAQIISSGKTGMIEYGAAAPGDSTVAQLTGGTTVNDIAVTSAQLTNGNKIKPFTATTGAAEGDIFFYCAECDTWHRESDDCVPTIVEITWIVNGVDSTQGVDYNTVPVYNNGVGPTKAYDEAYHYTFAGWSTSENGTVLESLPAATQEATYYAVFTAKAHSGTVVDGYDAADCTEAGETGNVYCECGKLMQESETIPALGHKYDSQKTAYVWADDDSTCTASNTCTVCSTPITQTAGKTNLYSVKITSEVTSPATCTKKGTTTYTAPFTAEWAETQTKAVQDIPMLDHSYTTKVSGTIASAATCEKPASYYVQCDNCTAVSTTETVESGEALGHAWGETSYNFAEDGKSCTATRVCTRDESHKETAEATVTEKVFEEPGCESVGETQYTATFTETWAQTQYKYLENLPATDHDWGEPDSYTDNGDTHTANYVCGNDASHTKSDAPVEHTYVNGVCVCEKVQTFTVTWVVDGVTVKTETVEYGENATAPDVAAKEGHSFAWDNDGKAIKATTTITGSYTANSYDYTIETYTMGTDGKYGEPVTETKTAVYGSTVSVSPEAKTGFTVDGDSVTSATIGIGKNVLSVYYIRNQYDVNYTVDGAEHKTETYYYEAPITALAAPTKEGHTFSGWDEIPASMPASDVYVYGSFTVNSYTITYMVDGTEYKTETYTYGSAVSALTAPSKDYDSTYHYTFSGWSKVPASMPAENLTITGSFEAVEHSYTPGEYKWDGTAACTVTGRCACGHSVDANAEISSKQSVAPTCEDMGTTTYTATFTETWAKTQTKDVQDIAAKGHSGTWMLERLVGECENRTDGEMTEVAYLIYKCSGCNGIFTTEDVENECTVTPATCSVTGSHIHVFDLSDSTLYDSEEEKVDLKYFNFENFVKDETADWTGWDDDTKTLTDTLVIAIDKSNHNWGEATYDFAADGSSCTATRVCGNDASHVETATAEITSEVTTPATCTEKGWTTYTATFTEDWAEEQTKAVQDIPALGHSGTWMLERLVGECENRTDDEIVTKVRLQYICSDCEQSFYSDSVTSYDCTVTPATCSKTGSHVHVFDLSKVAAPEGIAPEKFTKLENANWSDWNDDTKTLTNTVEIAIDQSNHAWGEASYTDNGDGTHTANYVCGNDTSHTKSETAPHTYNENTHACDCGKVQTFTLTIKDWESERIEIAKLTVPYGANLLEYLNTVEVKNIYKTGYVNKFSGEWLYYDNTKQLNYVGEFTIMPAEDLTVFANFSSTGWIHYADGYGYVIDDYPQHTGWTLIKEADYTENGTGSAWYYLDTDEYGDGIRAEGVSRVPYPTKAIDGLSYAPDQESINYAASKGDEFIDAKTGLFIFGTDGKFQQSTTGIGTYLDATRYAQNGHIAWHPGMVEAEGSYYYFIGDSEVGGNKLATGDVYVSRNTTSREFVISGLYTFGADGKLCEYDGITSVNGTLRYYEKAQLMLGAGLVKVGENYIYVRSNGELVVNAEYWVPTNNLGIVSGTYSFDENGYLISPEYTGKSGVYYENGVWYLYENGVKAYNMGLVSAQGLNWYGEDGSVSHTGGQNEYIYVRSSAQLATGTYYVTNVGEDGIVAKGTKCSFSDIGIYATGKDGIVNGYYYENNQIVYNAGLIEYGGGLIYVRSNGQVVMGQTYWITNTNGLKNAGFYEFDEDGYMVVDGDKNGIVEENGTLYYYVDGVKQMGSGLVKLDGGYIYVRTNGALAVGVYWITNNNGIVEVPAGKYTFGADGYMVQ